MIERDVVITGIGLLSSLGEGVEAHWNALSRGDPAPVLDAERFAPYTVHPLPEVNWSLQIPKRGDQRQMETWQRLGTYTAGLALEDAGLKGDEALCASMDMIVAAGGGERDITVDQTILDAARNRNDHDILINEKLTTELRPTLFLAQLSNLLAGNISIVHKVTGSSRTFMGEEGAGVSAIETAAARIRSGQSSHILVGAAFETEHPDMLLAYELGGYLKRDGWAPLWQRQGSEGGGVVTGSGAAFLVMEAREQAEKRGRQPYAAMGAVASARARRDRDELGGVLGSLGERIGLGSQTPLISAASGAHEPTAAESGALAGERAVRGFSGLTGHMKEVQFPFAVALAALSLGKERLPAPFSADERAFAGKPATIAVSAVGYHAFEGLGLVHQAQGAR